MKNNRTIKNIFAPDVENEYFNVSDLILGLQFGIFKYEKLSKEAKSEVDAIPSSFDYEKFKKEYTAFKSKNPPLL
jgi:hypothetical protein